MTTQQTVDYWCRRFPRSAPHIRAQAERDQAAADKAHAEALAELKRLHEARMEAKREAWRQVLGRAFPIVMAVCSVYQVRPADLLHGPHKDFLDPHCILAHLLASKLKMTAAEIGKMTFHDRSTVRHWISRGRTDCLEGVQKVIEEMEAGE